MKFPDKNQLLDTRIPEHWEFLSRIQGNILNGHGRKEGVMLVFRLLTPGPRPPAFWAEVADRITWASRQTEQALQHKLAKHLALVGGEVHRNFGLSAAGMQALGVADSAGQAIESRTPTEDLYSSFNVGMRGSFKATSSAVAAEIAGWEPAYQSDPLHGLWFVAGSNPTRLKSEIKQLRLWCKRWELGVAVEQPTRTWRHHGRPREAFGFVDGISVPEFIRSRRKGGGRWMSLPLSQVLISPDISPRHAGGSFLVVRKLEQNVKAFRAHERQMAGQLRRAGQAPWMAGPLLMGRKRDGRPLARLKPVRGVKLFNAFDFDGPKAEARCPFHAHIRKMNPRMDKPPDCDPDARVGEALRRVQIVRRAMLYDPEGRLAYTARSRNGWPEKEVGLLFMAFMSNPGRQFEVLHMQWAPDPNFPVVGTEGTDPVLATVPQEWRWQNMCTQLQQFVTPKGGEYFYTPSRDWLSRLAP